MSGKGGKGGSPLKPTEDSKAKPIADPSKDVTMGCAVTGDDGKAFTKLHMVQVCDVVESCPDCDVAKKHTLQADFGDTLITEYRAKDGDVVSRAH